MRRIFVVLILGLLGLAAGGPARAVSAAGLVADANAQRVAAGLPPLALNGSLSAAAAGKAADMIRNNYWSHVSPSGVGPWYWISAAGYPYEYAGENLAQGSADDAVVMAAWMASPEHRANLLSPNYRDMGCGFAEGVLLGNQTTVVACDFGSTAAEVNPPQLTTQPQPSAVAVDQGPAPVVRSAQNALLAAPTAQPPDPVVAAPDYFRRSVLFQPGITPALATLLKELR